MIPLSLGAVAFILVALKSWQQLNVFHSAYSLIPPTSYGLAYSELAILAFGVRTLIDTQDFWMSFLILGFCIGTGSWLGCFVSIHFHKRVRSGSFRSRVV